MENTGFYDKAAKFYDEMVSFENLLRNRITSLKPFTEGRSEAADLGCGTGVDSVALAQLGLAVTAFDASEHMLQTASGNASKFGAEIVFHNYSLDKIPDRFSDSADVCISLGNTLANLSEQQLRTALSNIYKMLHTGGIFLLQILNYERIVSGGERIINIKETQDSWTVRFYDFNAEEVMFNILRFSKDNPAQRELISTTVYPHRLGTMTAMLSDAGFANAEAFGNFDRTPFDAKSSADLIILCVK